MAANIATCHVESCQYNTNMDCQAPQGITVSIHQNHADCDTFEPGSQSQM